MSSINSLGDLETDIISKISSGYHIEPETKPILKDLLAINDRGFITFESQPTGTSHYGNRIWKQRAFLNGFYPRRLVPYLAGQLIQSDPDIIISETLLNPDKRDTLQLYNFRKSDRQNNVYGLYPMAESIENECVKYVDGYSGNITKPAIREDYMEDFNDQLMQDIYDKGMSLIQIWSRNIETNIFPLIVDSIQIVDDTYGWMM